MSALKFIFLPILYFIAWSGLFYFGLEVMKDRITINLPTGLGLFVIALYAGFRCKALKKLLWDLAVSALTVALVAPMEDWLIWITVIFLCLITGVICGWLFLKFWGDPT